MEYHFEYVVFVKNQFNSSLFTIVQKPPPYNILQIRKAGTIFLKFKYNKQQKQIIVQILKNIEMSILLFS